MLYRGFTLVEITLSIALIALVVGISVPVAFEFQKTSSMRSAKSVVVESLRRARILAQTGEGDSAWGVAISSGTTTLFQGTSFFAHDNAYDEVFTFAPSIAVSGLSEVVFSKITGIPQMSGDIVLTAQYNDTRTISINSQGRID